MNRACRLATAWTVQTPKMLVLLCPQEAVSARFSAQGAAAEAIEREAKMHYRELNWPA